MLSLQHVTWSQGVNPAPGWQQGLVTSLMLLPDPQLSGALLLKGNIPRNGQIKKKTTNKHKERKVSVSGLLALTAAWHWSWVAGSACRHRSLGQLGDSGWRGPRSARRLQKQPLPARTLPTSYPPAIPAIAPSQGPRYPHAGC